MSTIAKSAPRLHCRLRVCVTGQTHRQVVEQLRGELADVLGVPRLRLGEALSRLPKRSRELLGVRVSLLASYLAAIGRIGDARYAWFRSTARPTAKPPRTLDYPRFIRAAQRRAAKAGLRQLRVATFGEWVRRYTNHGAAGLLDGRGKHGRQRAAAADPQILRVMFDGLREGRFRTGTAAARWAIGEALRAGSAMPSLRTLQERIAAWRKGRNAHLYRGMCLN